VNYTTIREECRRCGGLGVENDWAYSSNGNVIEATNEELLIQELQKIVYSARGSNPFHPWYGTTLLEMIGQKLIVGGVLQNRIIADVQTAFSRWQSIKKQQEENLGQSVTDEEYPYQLHSVNLEQSQKDPTVLFVSITIRNRSYKKIDFVRGLRIPQPADLMGSTQQEAIAKEAQNYVRQI
jgi:phage baseplate assembly protein W